MAAANLTAARLREVLSYDPDTGVFRWRVTRNKAPAGKIARALHKSLGYIVIRVDGQLAYAHRLAPRAPTLTGKTPRHSGTARRSRADVSYDRT